MKKLLSLDELLAQLQQFAAPCSPKTIEQRAEEIPIDFIIEPNMPVGVFLQEAFNIVHFIQEDKALFLAKNFNWGIVEELPARIGFLREAEAVWWSAKFRPSPAVTEYKQLQARVDGVSKSLIDDIVYACADDKDVLKKLADIKKLSAESDCVFRLKATLLLAQSVADRLAAVGSDPQLIATLERYGETFPGTYSRYSIDFEADGIQQQRDRAYTFCAVAIEAVRRCAQYLFDGDRKQLRGYTSEYFRKSIRTGKSG